MATAGLSFESPLFKASSGVPSVVVNPYEPLNPTAATGLDGLGGGGMADIATLGRAAVQALSPSRFTLPEMKAPSIGYSPSKKQFFVQGTVFGEDDAQRALAAEQLLGGTPTGLPTSGDWVALTPQQYGQYTQSIREPGIGTLASKSFGRGVDVAQMLAGRGLQLAGAEQLGGRVVERQMEDLRKTSPYERQFTDIESGGDAVEWLVANAAQQGPNIIESIVTGALGFLAGTAASGNPVGGAAASVASLIGRESWKNSVKEALKKRIAGETLSAAEQKTLRNAAGIGMATAATFGNSLATGAADIYGELRERGADANDVSARLTAIAGSLPYAALDVMPEALLFGRLLGAGRPALSTLGTTRAKAGEILKRGAMGGAVGGLAEGTAELGQESLLLGLSDQDFADPQNINRLINSFAAGAGVGGPIGAGVNIVNPSNLLQPGASTQPVTGEQPVTPTLPADAPTGTQGELFPIAPGELAGPAVSMLPEQPAAPPMPQPGQMALFAPTAEDRLTRGIIPPGPGMQGELALVGGQVAPGYVPPTVFPTEQPAAPAGLTPLEAAAQGALQFAPAAPVPQGPTAVGLALQQAQQRQQMDQMRQQREAQLAAQREADLARLSNVAANQRQLDLIPPPPPFGVPMVPVTQAQPQQLPLFTRREAPIPPRAGQLRRGGRMQPPQEEVPAAPVSTVLTAEVLDATGLPKNSKFYRALLGKDMADPAQQPEIGATFGEIRASKTVKQSTRDAVEQLAMRAFGALATQAELGLAPPAPAPRERKPRATQEGKLKQGRVAERAQGDAGVGARGDAGQQPTAQVPPSGAQAGGRGVPLKRGAKPQEVKPAKPLKKAPPPAAAEEPLDIRYERGGPVGSFLQGAEKIGSGSESDVFRKGNIVIKVAEPYNDKSEATFNKRIADAIAVDRILGDGALKYIGYYLSPNGTKNPVFQQPLVEGRPATRQEIRSYMEGRGFSVSQAGTTTDTFTRTVDGQLLTARDLDGDNVRIDGTGRTRVIDGQLDFAPAPKKPLKKAPPPAAAPPAPGLDVRVSPDVATQRERNLRAKARDKERPGDVMLGNGTFVSMRDALEAARAAVADGVLNPEAPFQYSAVLDIAPRDWDRMVEAMRKPEKAPPPKPEGAVAAAPAPAPTEDAELDAALRRNADDAEVAAGLLSDALVGTGHLASEMRVITLVYLTEGAAAGRRALTAAVNNPRSGFGLMDLEDDERATYIQETDNFLADKASIFSDAAFGKELPIQQVAARGDDNQSPWLRANGRIIGTSGDHISAVESGTYSDHMRATGDVRAMFARAPDGSEYTITLHFYPGQRLTPQQLQTIETILKGRTEKAVNLLAAAQEGMKNPPYESMTLEELKSKFGPIPTKTAEEIEAEAAAARAALAAEAVDAETQWNDNRDTSDVMFADLPAAAKARWQASDRSGAAQITIVEELNDDLISMTNAERLNYALAAATAAVEANNNAQFDAVIDTIVDVAYFKPDGYSVEQQGEALDFLADPDNFTNAQNATIQDSFVTTAEGRTLEARTKPKKGEAGVGGGALKPWYTYASSVPGMIQRLAKASVVFRSLDRADAEQLLKDGMITRANLPDSVANAILDKEVTARAQDDATPQATPLAKLEALIAQTNRSTSPLNKQAQDNRNAELARLYKEATDQDFDTASVDQFFENGAPRTANVDGMFRVLNEEDYTNRDALEKANREERAAKDAARRAPRLSTFDDWEEDGRFLTDDGKPIAAPLSVGRVRIAVASFLSKLFVKPQVSIFRNQADLKARNPQLYARAAAARAAGDFDVTPAKGYSFGGNQVIIFTDRIRTEQELRFVLAHESLGHFGLRSIMPAADFDRLMEEIYDLSPNVQMAVDAAMAARGLPKAEAVEEYLADFAASLDVSYISKIWNAIKGFMNKLGVKFGDEAARYWVDQARRYVRTGQVSSAFTVQDVFTRMQAIESGQDPDNSGRFLRDGDLRMDNLRAADLMRDVMGSMPTDLAEAGRIIRGVAGNTAETADKFLAQVFSLMNFRARENAGAYEVDRTLRQGRGIAMSVRNALNEKLAPLLNRAIEVPFSKISFGGITEAQYDETNRALYGAQRLKASTAPTPKDLGRVPLYTVDPTTGELTPNQSEIDRLYSMGLISLEQMRDGFTFVDRYMDAGVEKATTVKVEGIPGLTKDSPQWKAYIAAREAMRDVELKLLAARYLSHTQVRNMLFREIGTATRTGKLTQEEKAFFEKVFAQYKALWTADPITDDKGRLAVNPESMEKANDFLAKFNTAVIATEKAAADPVAQERNDALRQFLDQPVADDLIASIEKFKDRFVLSDETRFLVQNRMKDVIASEISNDGADVATRRNLAIGYTPVLRRGGFQMRVQATVNGKAVRLKQEYKDQLVYSQFDTRDEAVEYSKRINDLFREDGKPKTYKVEAFNEDTFKYELMDVQLEAVPGNSLDGVAAPPELNLDDFVRGLRQFSIALPPRKMEQVIKALTDQNDRARQRLERNFVPGASPDAGRAVAEHIEARASTIAKIMMRPRLAELTNMNMGSTRALWMGDENRLKMLEENWKQGVPGAKRDYDLYAYQYNKTNPTVKGVRVERGNQYFNEATRALQFLEQNRNIDESDFASGKLASQIRAATSYMQLGGSFATGALNYLGAVINSIPYMATYNDSTAFGGGFGLGRATNEFYRALRQVGLAKTVVQRVGAKDDLNTAEFYDRVADSPALQKKYKLTQDEAQFLADEIREGEMVPALSNATTNTARGRISSGLWQKTLDGWMWTFNSTEQAVRRGVGLAMYRMEKQRAIANGSAEADAQVLAREAAVNALRFTLGDYAVMNRPPMWRSGVLSFVYIYKTFPTMSIQLFRRLPRQGQIMMLTALFMLGGISAFPFAEDIEDLMDTIAQLLGFTKASIRFEIAKVVDSVAPGMSPYVLRGFANAYFAGNVADRVSVGNFIPGTGILLAGANVGREVSDLAGPALSMLVGTATSAVDLVRAAATERVTMVDVLRESPVTMFRALGDSVAYTQAGGVVDRRGYIVTPDDSAAVIATRLLGFYPADAAEQFQVIRVAKRMTDYQKEVVAGFRVAWVKAKIQGDEGQAQDVVDAVADWNESARGTGLEIRNFLTNANRALREAQRPAGERFLRAAPRAARQDIETMADLLGY